MFDDLGIFGGLAMLIFVWAGSLDGTRKSIMRGERLTRGNIRRRCKHPRAFTDGDGSELRVCIAPSDLQFALSRFKSSGISPRVISAV